MSINLVGTLPENIKDKVAIRILYETISKYWNDEIETQVQELIHFRSFETNNNDIANSNATALGLDYSEDAPLSIDEYKKLASVINSYNANYKGLKFLQVLNYIYRVKFSIAHLWAKGEEEYWENIPETEQDKWKAFFEETQEIIDNSIISGTGDWYPTSHFDLQYASVNEQIDDISIDSLRYLVEKLAPINLVLRSISKKLIITPEAGNGGDGSGGATTNTATIKLQISTEAENHKRWIEKRSYIYDSNQYEFINFLASDPIYIAKTISTVTTDSWYEYTSNTYSNNNAIQFTRGSSAYYDGLIYGDNIPRFINSRLYIEPAANNLLYKTVISVNRVTLLRGTYTFSCIDSSFSLELDGISIAVVENNSFTFTVDNPSAKLVVTRIYSGNYAKYQLETGSYATTFIVNGVSRLADNLSIGLINNRNIILKLSDINKNIGNTIFTASNISIKLVSNSELLVKVADTETSVPMLDNNVISLSLEDHNGMRALYINNKQVGVMSTVKFSMSYLGFIDRITILE